MYRSENIARLAVLLICLILCAGPIAALAGPSPDKPLPDETDTVAPSPVTDLRAVAGRRPGEVRLLWTAVGDDGAAGKARKYAIKYSTRPIDASNWDDASVVDMTSEPTSAGKRERLTIVGLDPEQVYYFAVRVCDEASNWSEFSNAAQIDLATAEIDTIPPAAIMDLH
jgi:hypothetical protein